MINMKTLQSPIFGCAKHKLNDANDSHISSTRCLIMLDEGP